ncbi:hypothetical protein AgCh_028841 [Apium graveolens]
MTNKYGVVLLVDVDDLEYSLNHWMVRIREDCELSASIHSSKSVHWGSVQGDSVSSGSYKRNLVGSSIESEVNSRESNELIDSDIPYYRSFDATSMVVSSKERDMLEIDEVKNPMELTKGMTFQSKDKLMNVVKKVHIANHLEIKVVKSNSITWEVVCK